MTPASPSISWSFVVGFDVLGAGSVTSVSIAGRRTPTGRVVRRGRQLVAVSSLLCLVACTSTATEDTEERPDAPVRVELEGVTPVPAEAGLEGVLFEGARTDADDIEFAGDDPMIVVREPLTPAAREVAQAARAQVIEIGDSDVLGDPAAISAIRAEPDRPVVVVGDDATAAAVRLAHTQAPLPTGTYRVFEPATHYIGLYGHPNTARLGILGEQGPAAAVTRLDKLLDDYREVAPEASFRGVFEIIATVATGGPGKRGTYSQDTSIDDLTPLVDAAGEAGVLVLLDLQPGREDFVTQAKRYGPLLVQPHVGLALDPEWRLAPDQVHLRQIGSVSASEVNQTADWLASLVREHALPQKLFVVHQFRSSMIRDRADLNTSHPELATMIHVDGQGSRSAKFATWRHLLTGAPDGLHWGWKNFIDEDPQMLSPQETWAQVDPAPGLVTYQ